ncbi:right-handed parallel beta-helix repeat-containing protein [Paenibacillus eucommiae]|uniref:Parallel beta-helix repeat protein n=1 Tax=Paenibacillus eucommiae TaxID=1355755 RepID=A0ABS4ITQ4_9BACL|nr:right-handed parallel beta-helix repeat-containing protein [Paenibacillus eucommiae]MBP1990966.1 parallel beta-helix repeat protein [Paenibacillus eucommiae]
MNSTNDPHTQEQKITAVISRRKLLGVIGATGAALTVGSLFTGGGVSLANGDSDSKEWLNVRRKGVKGNGTNDDRAKLNSLIGEQNGKLTTFYFPPGVYRIGSLLDFPEHIRLILDPGATLAPDSTVTVKIMGRVEAKVQQIFSGAGEVLVQGTLNAQVYPQWWGAKGDGITDDTAAIQKAADAASSLKGKVFFSQGTYLFSTNIRLKDNTSLEGESAVLKAAPGVNDIGIMAQNCSNIRISHLTIEMNNPGAPGQSGNPTQHVGIKIISNGKTSSGFTISHVTVKHTKGYGIWLQGLPDGNPVAHLAQSTYTVDDVLIEHVTVESSHMGIVVAEGRRVEVSNCKVSKCLDSGILLYHCSDYSMVNNNCSSNAGHGITADLSRYGTTSGNICHDNINEQSGLAWGIVMSRNCQNFVVNENVCRGNMTGGISIDVTLDDMSPVKTYGIVSNNVCTDAIRFHGIYATYAHDLEITGNHCSNNKMTGIQVGPVHNVNVSANTCKGNETGINTAGNSTNLLISSNVSNENKVYGIVFYETSYSSLQNNTIQWNGANGIHVGFIANSSIAGNVCTGNGELNAQNANIWVLGGSQRNSVQGNTVRRDRNGAAVSKYGIVIDQQCTSNLVMNNDAYEGGTTEGIWNNETTTHLVNNRKNDGTFA